MPKTRKHHPTRRNPSNEVQEQPDFDSNDDSYLELTYRDLPVQSNTRFTEVYETETMSQNGVPLIPVVQDIFDRISADDLPVSADSPVKCLPSQDSKIDITPILNFIPDDDPEVVEPEANENLPADTSDTWVDQRIPARETEIICEHETAKEKKETNGNTIRKSNRVRQRPRIFTYPELGNPLVSIVQSLFQSLSKAVTDSIVESSFTNSPEPVVTQPVSCMHRDVHRVNGGGCNP